MEQDAIRSRIETEIMARWYADGAEVSLRRIIDRMAETEAELALIVDGWETIERGDVRGRRLTAWEEERLALARATLAKARGETT